VEPEGGSDAVAVAAALLGEGRILAIKGLGGVHLACDATNAAAVSRLRRRKRRYGKPFAVMARDLQVVRRYCSVDAPERALLEHAAAPIVILTADGPERVAPEVAPGQRSLGIMLPYTPLHHLLLQDLAQPIVLTSGNLSQEPQCMGNEEARKRLGTIAEYFLLHDRDIVNRVDDSVVRVVDDKPRLLRRARGYAPSPLALPRGFEASPPLLALGGELKNTFCLVSHGKAILSQHMGDLEDATTHADQRRSVELYLALFQHAPKLLAVDRHPEYLATKMGRQWAVEKGLKLEVVQHHHAHVAGCLAENGLPRDAAPVLGVALDGLGYGMDGTLWGGEFMLTDYRGFQRLGALKPIPMLGGVQAIREPWRNTYAHIESALGWRHYRDRYAALELTGFLEGKPLRTLAAMRERGLNCPLASSCGRLFDAVAAALGVCRERAVYEGQAAMELEALVDDTALGEDHRTSAYPFSRKSGNGLHWLDYGAFWRALFNDRLAGVAPGIIAARFHKGLARAVVSMAWRLSRAAPGESVDTVALSGGVFQNSILLALVVSGLRERGFRVLTHSLIPANDGGLALGQAVIAAARALDGNSASANQANHE
jgi:hydrogenase maturation protein HypF